MAVRLFGKLPAHGDFVARGLSAAARTEIDGWLSASMIAARTAFGADFDARFDAALPWRCDGDAVIGAIAASQDAAGRRFPIVLLAGGDDPADCEALLYRAIGDGWSADTLVAAAEAAPAASPERWYGGAGDERAAAMPADIVSAMLA